MTFKLGTVVRQKITPIEGPVTGYSLDQTDGTTLLHVEYTDENGEPAAKYFKASEVEEVPPPPELEAAVEKIAPKGGKK